MNSNRILVNSALVVVDMQHYYLANDSDYYHFFTRSAPTSLDYIHTRCREIVIPALNTCITAFENHGLPIIFLKLCSSRNDREDLHRFFRETFRAGQKVGLDHVYPRCDHEQADIHGDIHQPESSHYITKTTFSGFTSPGLDELLRKMSIDTLFFTGLATSQCVETTARDASDRGYRIIHVEDCLADYDETTHRISLLNSHGVCGNRPVSSSEVTEWLLEKHPESYYFV